jgi:hypothetical protein
VFLFEKVVEEEIVQRKSERCVETRKRKHRGNRNDPDSVREEKEKCVLSKKSNLTGLKM